MQEGLVLLEGVLVLCKCKAQQYMADIRYMGNYPPATRTNFFAAVDRWQGPLILAEHSKASQPTYGAAWTDTSLLALPTAVIQLLFNEPTLLDNADISSLLDATIASSSQKTQKTASAVTHLGLTPVLIRLLSSPDQARRDWASSQIPATVRRPLTFGEWCSLGIGLEIQAFYGANDASSTEERWQTVQLIVQSRSLSPDTVRKGLLGGITTEGAHGGRKGVMAVLSNQLGSETCEIYFFRIARYLRHRLPCGTWMFFIYAQRVSHPGNLGIR